jgi:8-oxo-dGTP pyrophosphatase MutT (NUDIX family)
MPDLWKPNVTVAAVVARDGRFLFVEENTPDGLRINQPAGHLEPGESLAQAAVREALEETAHDFHPTALLGVYLMPTGPLPTDTTYLRVAFIGELGRHHEGRALDPDIIRTVWLTRDEIAGRRSELRSPLVLQCVDDFLAGRRGGLELVAFAPLGPHPRPLSRGAGEGSVAGTPLPFDEDRSTARTPLPFGEGGSSARTPLPPGEGASSARTPLPRAGEGQG